MHLVIASRGAKHEHDRFITELNAKYLPIEFTEKKTGKKITRMAQVVYRPIRLGEIIFPEEHLETVCQSILDNTDLGKTHHKKHRKYFGFLRKILGLKKLPDFKIDASKPTIPIFHEAVEIVAIGTKKDRRMVGKIDGKDVEYEGL
jgi:hypothetical protein